MHTLNHEILDYSMKNWSFVFIFRQFIKVFNRFRYNFSKQPNSYWSNGFVPNVYVKSHFVGNLSFRKSGTFISHFYSRDFLTFFVKLISNHDIMWRRSVSCFDNCILFYQKAQKTSNQNTNGTFLHASAVVPLRSFRTHSNSLCWKSVSNALWRIPPNNYWLLSRISSKCILRPNSCTFLHFFFEKLGG